MTEPEVKQPEVGSGCPVGRGRAATAPINSLWPFTSVTTPTSEEVPSGVPASLEEAARHAQTPQPDQVIRLDTHRQISSIPRGEAKTPEHQHGDDVDKWVYPSEQQLYNAMRRKGWANIPEESIPTVLQIHNNVNEKTWQQIQEWEETTIKLARFQGRPRDLSPKAFFMSYVLRLYDPPFDRHDWHIAHPTGLEQRYVIDYYYLQPKSPGMPPIPYIDARPALDNPRAFWLRTKRFLQLAFPGITSYAKRNWQTKSD